MTNTENNMVNIVGTIDEEPRLCKEYGVEKFYSFPVAVKRLNGVADVLQVLASDLICSMDTLKKDSYVNVIGQLRSRSRRDKTGSKQKIYIFADSVLGCDSDRSDNNVVVLTGTLYGTVSFRKCASSRIISKFRILLKRKNNRTVDLIPVIAWGRLASYIKELPVGTQINICGRLQERKFDCNCGDKVEQRIVHELSVQTIKLLDNDIAKQTNECGSQKGINENDGNKTE